MKAEQSMLTLAGIAGIAAFFLPYIQFEQSILGISLVDTYVSGLTYTRSALDATGVLPYEGGRTFVALLQELWTNAQSWQDYGTVAGLLVVISGPIFYLLYSLGYLFRGLFGKQYKRGIFFNFIYMGASWGICKWITATHSTEVLGKQLGLNLNFFANAGLGYWIAFAAVIVAGFSLLFEPKRGKTAA